MADNKLQGKLRIYAETNDGSEALELYDSDGIWLLK